MRKFISILMAMVVVLTFIAVSPAQSISGKSTLSFSTSSATLSPNSSLSVDYTMTLVNGTAGPTFMIIANGGQLAGQGVGVGVNPGSGTPPFSGTINIHVAANATPGVYNIVVETGGADPDSGAMNFTVTVPGGTGGTTVPPTTVSGGTTAPTTVQSTAPTTVPASSTVPAGTGGYSSSTGALVLVAVLVIVVLAVIAVVVLRNKKG